MGARLDSMITWVSDEKKRADYLARIRLDTGEVPDWIRDLASEDDGEILSLNELRKALSGFKRPLSEEILLERYGEDNGS